MEARGRLSVPPTLALSSLTNSTPWPVCPALQTVGPSAIPKTALPPRHLWSITLRSPHLRQTASSLERHTARPAILISLYHSLEPPVLNAAAAARTAITRWCLPLRIL